MREIRLALLEADVNFKVVKQFTSTVKERCLGAEVQKQLNPGQQVVKIVNEELTALMGGQSAGLTFSPRPPSTSTARPRSSSSSRSADRPARRSTSRARTATRSTSPRGRSTRPSG